MIAIETINEPAARSRPSLAAAQSTGEHAMQDFLHGLLAAYAAGASGNSPDRLV